MSAQHLVPIGDGAFGVWRSVCVRGAGMPYDWISDPTAVNLPKVVEAVGWQNPRVGGQLRDGVRGTSRNRQLDRTVAGYLSRYCAKNDTIGYFGPVAWGEWVDGAGVDDEFRDPARGPVLLELWAVRAVADALLDRYDLDEWTVPHVAPAIAVGDTGVHLYDGSWLPLAVPRMRILRACDGFRTAADVGAECSTGGDADQVAADVRRLRAMGLLTTGFAVAQARHPEQQLRMQLFRVADADRRDAALAELGELVDARDAVTRALGDPDKVAAALVDLDQVFGRITGRAARQRAGEFYAGRALAYEDCVSPRRARLGTRLLDDLAPVLDLLLTSSRWFSSEVARRYLDAAREVIGGEPGRGHGYPLPLLLGALAATFTDPRSGPAYEAATRLRERWTSILVPEAVPPRHGPVRWTACELRDRVAREFAAIAPGWPTARWHSPDIMLAAASTSDIAAGRYLAVVGELHPAINAIDQLLFLAAHPDQAAVRRFIDADMPHRVVPLYPLPDMAINSRTAPPEAYHSPGYTYLGTGREAPYHPARARRVPMGALRVYLEGDRVVVRSVVDDFEADLVEVLDDYLSTAAYNRFGLLSPAPYRPRVEIDKVVVARATWRVPFTEFAELSNARLERVLAEVRRVWARFGLPTVAFAVITDERKPMYVDIDDPPQVDALWSKLRRGRGRSPHGELVVSEMLPGPDQLWLRDAEGNRYTTEYRLVCVDSATYRPGA